MTNDDPILAHALSRMTDEQLNEWRRQNLDDEDINALVERELDRRNA